MWYTWPRRRGALAALLWSEPSCILPLGDAPADDNEIWVMVQSPQPAGDSNDADRLERCQQRLGYSFRDPQLLESALTHASGADHRLSSNERLEFLGDAILGLVVCEQLFTRFPDQLEGDLTKLKSV